MEELDVVGDEQENTTTDANPQELKFLDEVSNNNRVTREEERFKDENDLHNQVFYDASNELKYFEGQKSITVQLKNGKGIIIP